MTGLDLSHVKRLWVRPALAELGLDADAAVNLVTGTALAESGCVWLEQIRGPALGLWQMEPATHDDCWANFLLYPRFSRLATALHGLTGGNAPSPGLLVTHPLYAAAMCRIKYYRAPDPLPVAGDAAGLSAYHKRIYNSPLGAADAAANVRLFQQAINA